MAFLLSSPFHTLHLQTPHNPSPHTPNPSSHRISLTPTCKSPLHSKPQSQSQHLSSHSWSFEQRMEEALTLLDLMESQSLRPDPALFCILLKSCADAHNLEFGKTIHSKIVGTDFERDVFVANNLINFYAKCGCLKDARRVFDEMPQRNEVTWTSMISVYSQWGLGEEALRLFSAMKLEKGVRPNAFSYSVGLNLCAKLRDLEMGVEIHGDVVREGCESDEYVVTALIDMYAKCGRIESARRVFDKVREPTIVACTAMIDGYNNNGKGKEALDLIRRILHLGLDVTVVKDLGFTCMIRACTVEAAYRQGQEIHAHIIKFGYEMGAQTLRALVMLYEKCDKMVLARRLFEKLVVRNDGLWEKMISGYVRNGMNQEALDLYAEMVCEDIQLISFTLSCALKACAGMLALKQGKEIQGRATKGCYDLSDDSVVAALVLLYSECRIPEEVHKLTKNHENQTKGNL